MKGTVYQMLVKVWRKPKYRQIRGVFSFVVITLVIHYSYRFWAQDLHFYPIKIWMTSLRVFFAQMVYEQSTWVDYHIMVLNLEKDGMTMFFPNGAGITINGSCSGVKQSLQMVLLLLIYPGKWKFKLWFIPVGIIVVHVTNILRIVLLSIVAIWMPERMDLIHDTLLRVMFYVVIFGVWLLFVKLSQQKRRMEN